MSEPQRARRPRRKKRVASCYLGVLCAPRGFHCAAKRCGYDRLAMKMKTAWSRGLVYGGIFGGAIAVVPVLAGLLVHTPLSDVAAAGGMIILIWGTLGFLAG